MSDLVLRDGVDLHTTNMKVISNMFSNPELKNIIIDKYDGNKTNWRTVTYKVKSIISEKILRDRSLPSKIHRQIEDYYLDASRNKKNFEVTDFLAILSLLYGHPETPEKYLIRILKNN
jgi:hypothetical protein